MLYRIDTIKKVTVGTTASDTDMQRGNFFIRNNGGGTLYFKEKEYDGAAVTADNGFVLAENETFPHALNCKTLSMKATASTDVRLMLVEEV